VAEFDEVIAPGQEGKITLEVVGKKVSGSFSKNATVHSNDPDHPRLTLSIAGQIMHYVDIQPERVYLRGMYGEAVSKELTVVSNEKKKDFQILELSSNIDDKITYRIEPEAEPGRYKVKLFKNPKLPTLNTWGSLTVKTNSEKSPEKIIQVNVVTRGSIVCQPTTLNFGAVRVGATLATQGLEKELTIFKVKGDFNITDITFSSDRYQASVEPLDEGKKYKVVVGFSPSGEQKSYVDEMIIRTDDPQEPSIRVRLLARGV
jgi:hypothetical protein